MLVRFHYSTVLLWKICHTLHESSTARKEQSSFKSFCHPTSCSCMQLSNSLSFLHQYHIPTLQISNMWQQIGILLPFECLNARQLWGKQDTLPSVELSLSHHAPPVPWGLGCSGQLSRQELKDWETKKMFLWGRVLSTFSFTATIRGL